MPENELSVIKLSRGLRSNLTAREKHDLVKAERTIAKGLKSFLAVGMALKEIRDNRLYYLCGLGSRRGFVNNC